MDDKFDLISALTELVSTLPYGNFSIDERQKVYDEWRAKYYIQLKNIERLLYHINVNSVECTLS